MRSLLVMWPAPKLGGLGYGSRWAVTDRGERWAPAVEDSGVQKVPTGPVAACPEPALHQRSPVSLLLARWPQARHGRMPDQVGYDYSIVPDRLTTQMMTPLDAGASLTVLYCCPSRRKPAASTP